MPTATLRKVGGSVMLAVPRAILDLLDLREGMTVELAVRQGLLVVDPRRKPSYSLDELLGQCETGAPRSHEDREWINLPAAGREL
jgi:antitoxin ChpS